MLLIQKESVLGLCNPENIDAVKVQCCVNPFPKVNALRLGKMKIHFSKHIPLKTITTKESFLYKDSEPKEYSLEMVSIMRKTEKIIPYLCDQIFHSLLESMHSLKSTW